MILFELQVVFELIHLNRLRKIPAFKTAFKSQRSVIGAFGHKKVLEFIIKPSVNLVVSPDLISILCLAADSNRLRRVTNKSTIVDSSCNVVVWPLRQVMLQRSIQPH